MTDANYESPTPDRQGDAQEESLQIGAFSGYNRRPLPANSGLTAQFYGENGEDADTISALNLTKFLEADALINVYLIKDALGRVMKEEGQYPKIASFVSKIQRPKPLRDGLIAQFFSLNGDDADAINDLGKTRYLDAFVYVEILKPQAAAGSPSRASGVALPAPSAELDALARQLTPSERKELAKRSKAFAGANSLLKLSGFLNQEAVWAVLGNEFDYKRWLEPIPCCASGESPCPHRAEPFKIPAESHVRYSWIPLCAQHAEQASAGLLPGGVAFMRLRRQVLIQQWAWDKLKAAVGTDPSVEEPDPVKIMNWANEHKLSQYVPGNYLNKF